MPHDSPQHDNIFRICLEHGLTLRSYREEGPLLELTPVDLDALPDPQTLAALVEALRQATSRRYVALNLDATQDR